MFSPEFSPEFSLLALIISLLAVIGFGAGLWLCRIADIARSAVNDITTGLCAITNSELDDDAKEVAVRRAGFALIRASFGILWRFALAIVLAAAPIYLAAFIGLTAVDDVFSLMLRWDYIIIVSVVAIVIGETARRLRPKSANQANTPYQYSATDRAVHVLAFASPIVLKTAGGLEHRLAGSKAVTESPIFITSLARGGTTALLNALSSLPQIASHTYRDMPFVTAPTLWRRLSGGDKRQVTKQQRAHGDGLEIDLDSPEAFEEVIWKLFWPNRFKTDTIPIWLAETQDAKANTFLTKHMAQVAKARGGSRYCSKNNGNIARLAYLRAAFPNAKIVVPVRRPDAHAASLWRQHQRFSELQAGDDFIRRYMADIGHYDFGLLHKPIAFEGFATGRFDPASPDYWLDYWIHAFTHVTGQADQCLFVDQDKLRADPKPVIDGLLHKLDLQPGDNDLGGYFLSKPDPTADDLFDGEKLSEAMAIYRGLAGRSE
ncbi:MAG: sulfotransferase [Alphaproteobacteria bacterium]|nr:sulfotransferase [Alphaproteobacteria bacterium SS10]